MHLRPATLLDAPALRQAFLRAFAEHTPTLGYRPSPMDRDFEPLLEHNFGLALDWDGAPVGFAVTRPTPSHLYLEAIAMDPRAQGRGGGTALLGGVERLAGQLCLPMVRLHTAPSLTRVMRFYRHAGYQETGVTGHGAAARAGFEKAVATALEHIFARSTTP